MNRHGAPGSARSPAVDALRGAAIVSMFAANLAGPCLLSPHPLWLRAFGSFAAPAFVLLAGMMAGRGGRRSLRHLLVRAAGLLALAAAIDVLCWGIAPFETFDVLYLLALALPLAGLSTRVPLGLHALLALLLIGAAPWLRDRLGYGPLLPDQLAYPWPAWRRLLVDGWFPIFPWLGVALVGSLAGRLEVLRAPTRAWLEPVAGSLLVLGALAWWLAPPQLVTRGGYSELFYPPSWPYLALALSAVLLALSLLERLARRHSLAGLTLLGRYSLMLYVAHVALIALLLDEWFGKQPLPAFLGLFAALSTSMWLMAWLRSRHGLPRLLDDDVRWENHTAAGERKRRF